MDKLKIFISSRVGSAFKKLDQEFTLEQLRTFLRKSLESETFLGEKMLQIVTNEESFDESLLKDAFDTCMATMRSCNVIIILYSGEAGWSLSGENSTNGICHEEFLIALDEFSDMAFLIDISSFFNLPKSGEEWRKNQAFADDVTASYRHRVAVKAKTVDEMKERILSQTRQYILKAVEKSFATQKISVSGSAVFGQTLDWSKLSYTERQGELKAILETVFLPLPEFENVIKAFHAVPDNMSVSDARNSIGRPFLYEHKSAENRREKSGVIHFIAVYGNVTEIQAKNLVGYPDITVIKAPFGFYLWEKNLHIQIFFFKSCINPRTLKTRYTELVNWLNSSREKSKIIERAAWRFRILDAINNAKY